MTYKPWSAVGTCVCRTAPETLGTADGGDSSS